MEISKTLPSHSHSPSLPKATTDTTPTTPLPKDFFSLGFRVDVDAADERGANLYARLPGKWNRIGFPVRECSFERLTESGPIEARPKNLFDQPYKSVFISPSDTTLYKAIEDESQQRDFHKNHLEIQNYSSFRDELIDLCEKNPQAFAFFQKAADGGFRRGEQVADVIVNVNDKHAARYLGLETRAEWSGHRINLQWIHGKHIKPLSSFAVFAAVCRELDAWKGHEGLIYSEKMALPTGQMPADEQRRGDIELDVLAPEPLASSIQSSTKADESTQGSVYEELGVSLRSLKSYKLDTGVAPSRSESPHP